ncbi:MAG: O-acetyl-ADP-ribose deacetylase [Chitinophagaceae bacterium]
MAQSIIQVIQGDITTVSVDVIVNAANSGLLGGGGVDGAIHRAGGPAILQECRKIVARQGGCPTGEAVITTAGNLPAKYVIHTVGPVWQGGTDGEAELLASCYSRSLTLAVQHSCRSIAFPNISTGVYGYPKQQAAQVATQAVRQFLQSSKVFESVFMVCFDDENYTQLQTALQKLR